MTFSDKQKLRESATSSSEYMKHYESSLGQREMTSSENSLLQEGMKSNGYSIMCVK